MADDVPSGRSHKQRMGMLPEASNFLPDESGVSERRTAEPRRTRMSTSEADRRPENLQTSGATGPVRMKPPHLSEPAAADGAGEAGLEGTLRQPEIQQSRRSRMTDSGATNDGSANLSTVRDSQTYRPVASGDSRVGKAWLRKSAFVLGVFVLSGAIVMIAQWVRGLPPVASWLESYPGVSTTPESTPVGLPGWLGWQHFLNMFFIVLIVRTGLQVRHEKKAPGHFTPKRNSFFAPKYSTPKKISLSQWTHQALDVLWVINGLVFIVLLFVSGQWMKIVPTSWDVIPNALSAALQYASLDWPAENGWIHYNALQMLAYSFTVFVAAPLAALSGIRFSTWWPDTKPRLCSFYPVEIARAIHYPVMVYFIGFTAVHVFLVFFTGALENLNHMYTSRESTDSIGLMVFLGSLLVITLAWLLMKPLFLRPIAQKFGTVTK